MATHGLRPQSVILSADFPGGVPRVLLVGHSAIPPPFAAAAAADGFTGEPETACDILGGETRILLVGRDDAFAAGALAASRLAKCPHIALDARDLTAAEASEFAAGACARAWHYGVLRTRADEDAPRLAELALVGDADRIGKKWASREAVARGVAFARDLVAAPSNLLTPRRFVEQLAPLIAAGVDVAVIDAAALKAGGFGGIAAVGRGSAHPPCLAILRWPGSNDAPPVAFVGKGITFDTGGISIKPADKMWEMRADMAGAAACAGALLALALRECVAPVTAFLALAENAIGGNSYRPGDVLRMVNGTTVQVVDTDAEGRLVLADALAYAVREKPQAVIDLATLTGSIVTALGHERAGCFDNDAALAAAAAAAGAAVGEPVWRMPVSESDRRALDSDIADIKHCVDGRLQPDACHAAAFLREFVGETPWVHLDIAGVESREDADDSHAKGPTGFGVRLLDRLIADRFEDPHRV